MPDSAGQTVVRKMCSKKELNNAQTAYFIDFFSTVNKYLKKIHDFISTNIFFKVYSFVGKNEFLIKNNK